MFAFWAVRREAWRDGLSELFVRSRRFAVENFDSLVKEELRTIAATSGLTRAMIEDYLTYGLHYELTRADEEGLALFYRLASEEGALSQETAAISR